VTEPRTEDEREPDDAAEDGPPKRKVTVPVRRDALGGAEYVEADEDAAWQWDVRRWERLR
jgi:hypothetical protein